jgi:hypothetical protein
MKKLFQLFITIFVAGTFLIPTPLSYAKDTLSRSIRPIRKTQCIIALGTYEKGEATSMELRLPLSDSKISSESWVTILLPDSFTIPELSPHDFVFSEAIALQVQKTGNNNIRLQTPADITELLSISIALDAGIRNPMEEDSFVCTLFIESWEEFFESDPVSLQTPHNSILVEMQNQTKPNQHEWISEIPIVQIYSEITQDIFVSLDQTEFSKLDDPIFTIPEGIHTLSFYGVRSSGLKEKIKTISWKVDPYPPSCIEISPSHRSWINTQHPLVTFQIASISPAFLVVSEEVYPVLDNEVQVQLSLKPGKNTVSYDIINQAGHRVSDELTLFVDVTPPAVTIYYPLEGQIFCGYQMVVMGKSEPSSSLLVNGIPTKTDAYGNFSTEIPIKEGENNLLVRSEDRAGNTTELHRTFIHYTGTVIEIQLAHHKSFLNEKEIEVEPFPFRDSQNGEVYVPIRLFAESLGYSLRWDSKLNAAILEKDGMLIYVRPNDSIIKVSQQENVEEIDVYYAPTIVEGVIVVPIEFTKIILGSEVKYNQKQDTILIIFCPERSEK